MAQVLEAERTEVGRDILWTVIQPTRNGDEKTLLFTTQVEAQQALLTAFAHNADSSYGITINVQNANYDQFFPWTAEDDAAMNEEETD
jgi:hypothetical protein